MKRTLVLLATLGCLPRMGCGPTQSTALIIDADVQLESARAADGPKLAPYEYTSAEVYLHKARELQGYANFEVSIDFGRKAVKFANEARQKAMAAKAEGALPSVPSMPSGPPSELKPGEKTVDKVEKVDSSPK